MTHPVYLPKLMFEYPHTPADTQTIYLAAVPRTERRPPRPDEWAPAIRDTEGNTRVVFIRAVPEIGMTYWLRDRDGDHADVTPLR